jgi:hypothetical protein
MKFNDRLDGMFGPIQLDYHRYKFCIEVDVASHNDVSGVSSQNDVSGVSSL